MNFEQLPKEVRERVLEEHRDINVDYDWAELIIDDFKEEMKSFGISVSVVYWSGFWSQGDGACFEGSISDMSTLLNSVDALKSYANIIDIQEIVMSWTSRGNHCHEHTLRFELYDHRYEPDGDEPADVIKRTLVRYDNSRIDGLEKDIAEWVREQCRALYTNLEEEYEYRTSDEQIIETLEADDMLDDAVQEACDHYGYELETETQTDEATETGS